MECAEPEEHDLRWRPPYHCERRGAEGAVAKPRAGAQRAQHHVVAEQVQLELQQASNYDLRYIPSLRGIEISRYRRQG